MKSLRVLDVAWHVGHAYELMKLPFFETYNLLENPYRGWQSNGRPLPEKVKMVNEVKKGEYDLMINHYDQQCLLDRNPKGKLMREMQELAEKLQIPQVIINHQTPRFDDFEDEEVKQLTKRLMGDTPMIVNSNQAREQWGWGHTIIHGMEADEWLDLPKEPRVITVLARGGLEKAYDRSLLYRTRELLQEKGITLYWVGENVDQFPTFDKYKEFVGRSLVYFQPTKDSPMPRARTEAMLSGCCIVTTKYHDADSFIENGKNGFITRWNPYDASEMIYKLLVEHPDLAKVIGQKGKETARLIFTSENFAKQWKNFLTEINIL